MRQFLFLLVVCITVRAHSQNIVADTVAVVVHKDPRLDMLIKKESAINLAQKKAAGRTGQGYRLLVIRTNKRDDAIAAKAKIYQYFPELKSYLLYQSPFFKLKVGNFQNRDDAKKYQAQLNTIFPKGVFIINDTIEIKPEKDIDSPDD